MSGARARWVEGRVVFASVEAFDEELKEFLSKGALLVGGDAMALPPPLEPFEFRMASPAGPDVRLRGMIVARNAGGSLVQILDFSQALLARLRPPPAHVADATPGEPRPPVSPLLAARMAALAASGAIPEAGEFTSDPSIRHATGVFPATTPGAGPLAGTLDNPILLAGLRTLPLGAVAAVKDLAHVSTTGIVRYLGARRATGWLVLRPPSGSDEERRWGLEKGAYLLAPHEREAARAAFFWPGGSYQFTPAIPDHPPSRSPVLAWRLVLDAVKSRIREAPLAELRACVDPTRAVRLGAAYLERSRSLDLTATEERTIKRDFDGRRSLGEIVHLGGLSELGLLRLVFLLETLALVELCAPQGTEHEHADDVRAEYERVVSADLFAALGLHWSDAPERLPEALAAVRRRFGAGSPAAAQSPEFASRRVELAERAYRRLADKGERRRYRREVLGVDVQHAAELLIVQVPIARARGEDQRARELVAAACDLFDKPDWERLRRELGA